MHKLYIGIDNGVTGLIGIVTEKGNAQCIGMPVFTEQSYTKAKQKITRINAQELTTLIRKYLTRYKVGTDECLCILERPMINPQRFKASLSAIRALEATLIVLESLGFTEKNIKYIDSKEWQKALLPKGLKGSSELKKASVTLAKRLYPSVNLKKDADGLLIAHYAMKQRM